MTTQTWHHGLVARWWAEVNDGGDDIEFFASAIAKSGPPVLDAGCGTGRILLPLLAQGIDIDGSDAAPGMLQRGQQLLDDRHLSTRLYNQAMHELDTERTYQTVIICGAFGLGGSRADDLVGMRRVYASLKRGGTLVMDDICQDLANAVGSPGLSNRNYRSLGLNTATGARVPTAPSWS